MDSDSGQWWTMADIAREWGVKVKTIYWYRHLATHGKPHMLPEPDGYVGRVPVWRPQTVRRFERPGPTAPGTDTRAGRR